MIIRIVTKHTEKTIQDCTQILREQDINWEQDIEGSVIIYNSVDGSYEYPVATGSFSGNVVKCVAVSRKFEGTGLAQTLITALLQELYHLDRTHIFLFTKPKNKKIFVELGFHVIAEVPSSVILMENNAFGLKNYQQKLRDIARDLLEDKSLNKNSGHAKEIASIVMNCNPFTLGHRAIIEHAAKESLLLFVFIVSEDSSEFSAKDRLRLVQLGTQDLDNVCIIPGGDYIISRKTFPTYFLKNAKIIEESYARLDCTIFMNLIAPILSITQRYLGEEPFCPVTANYNKVLMELLPQAGITCTVIQRKTFEGKAISASEVRKFFAEEDMQHIKPLVPKTTFDFLSSGKADYVREKILDAMHNSNSNNHITTT